MRCAYSGPLIVCSMATVTSVTIDRPQRESTHADRVATTPATTTLSARSTSSSNVGAVTVVDDAGPAAATMASAQSEGDRPHGVLCIGSMTVRFVSPGAFSARVGPLRPRRGCGGVARSAGR